MKYILQIDRNMYKNAGSGMATLDNKYNITRKKSGRNGKGKKEKAKRTERDGT